MNRFDGLTQVQDLTVLGSFVPPANSVGSTQVTASDPIVTDKQRHRMIKTYAQDKGAASVSVTGRVIYVANAAGNVLAVNAGDTVANIGGATITVDVKKNGATILSAPISLSSANAAYAKVAGAIATAPYVAGDVFEVVVVATVGGGTVGQGVFAAVQFDEGP